MPSPESVLGVMFEVLDGRECGISAADLNVEVNEVRGYGEFDDSPSVVLASSLDKIGAIAGNGSGKVENLAFGGPCEMDGHPGRMVAFAPFSGRGVTSGVPFEPVMDHGDLPIRCNRKK